MIASILTLGVRKGEVGVKTKKAVKITGKLDKVSKRHNTLLALGYLHNQYRTFRSAAKQRQKEQRKQRANDRKKKSWMERASKTKKKKTR